MIPIEQGPELLRPLMSALISFYAKAAGQDLISSELPNLSSVEIRREMFKLFYKYEAFDLNLKADAFEALDFLLTCIHSWIKQS